MSTKNWVYKFLGSDAAVRTVLTQSDGLTNMQCVRSAPVGYSVTTTECAAGEDGTK